MSEVFAAHAFDGKGNGIEINQQPCLEHGCVKIRTKDGKKYGLKVFDRFDLNNYFAFHKQIQPVFSRLFPAKRDIDSFLSIIGAAAMP